MRHLLDLIEMMDWLGLGLDFGQYCHCLISVTISSFKPATHIISNKQTVEGAGEGIQVVVADLMFLWYVQPPMPVLPASLVSQFQLKSQGTSHGPWVPQPSGWALSCSSSSRHLRGNSRKEDVTLFPWVMQQVVHLRKIEDAFRVSFAWKMNLWDTCI